MSALAEPVEGVTDQRVFVPVFNVATLAAVTEEHRPEIAVPAHEHPSAVGERQPEEGRPADEAVLDAHAGHDSLRAHQVGGLSCCYQPVTKTTALGMRRILIGPLLVEHPLAGQLNIPIRIVGRVIAVHFGQRHDAPLLRLLLQPNLDRQRCSSADLVEQSGCL
jgi:hypothetical protein